MAALGSPSLENVASPRGPYFAAKSMRALTLPHFRLVRPLHCLRLQRKTGVDAHHYNTRNNGHRTMERAPRGPPRRSRPVDNLGTMWSVLHILCPAIRSPSSRIRPVRAGYAVDSHHAMENSSSLSTEFFTSVDNSPAPRLTHGWRTHVRQERPVQSPKHGPLPARLIHNRGHLLPIQEFPRNLSLPAETGRR